MDLDIIKKDVINILKEKPNLTYGTLLGYNEPHNNPNWFYGTYKLSDDNEYTIVLHNGDVTVYEGVCSYLNTDRQPIIKFIIDTYNWAYYSIIEIIN